MKNDLQKTGMVKEAGRTIIIARFERDEDANAGRSALDAIFKEAAKKTADLFKKQGGVADAVDIAMIYATHGLRNDVGWEQDYPVLTNEKDLAWALPTGVYLEDAQNLLLTLGATHVAIHEQNYDEEHWRIAPHPMMMPIIDDESASDESDDDDAFAVVAMRKRTLH